MACNCINPCVEGRKYCANTVINIPHYVAPCAAPVTCGCKKPAVKSCSCSNSKPACENQYKVLPCGATAYITEPTKHYY